MIQKKIKKIRVTRFLRRLDHLLSRVGRTYTDYHANKKKFKYAKKLRTQNEEIRILLRNNIRLLNFYTNKKEALALLSHIDEWSRLWDLEFYKKRPNEQDQFYFKNNINFPKTSVNSLINSKKNYL